MTQAQDVSYLRSLRPFLSKTGSSNHKIESYITRYESGDLTLTQCMRLIYQLDPTSTLVSDNNGLTATTEVICARPIITSSAALEKSSSAYTACAGGGFMRINGPDDSDFGLSLAIGDVTGDSLPELFVGANGNSGNGNLYVFADIATGLSSPATVSSVSFTISGLSNGDIGGSTITSDINNDGIADIIAGDANAGSSNEGKVYIFYGESSFDSSLTTSNASVTITGSSSSEGIGREVAVGDLNGDGIPD
ncbi:MAG: VCBS repeat-containing protein [Alphaproteobacteria bacterium]|nr:VCBS repeat-containing protein [Alphaproteobacteria bacterium]